VNVYLEHADKQVLSERKKEWKGLLKAFSLLDKEAQGHLTPARCVFDARPTLDNPFRRHRTPPRNPTDLYTHIHAVLPIRNRKRRFQDYAQKQQTANQPESSFPRPTVL